MTTLTLPVQAEPAITINEEPINLFQLGILFTIHASYWTGRAGNVAEELSLSPDRIQAKAIASFGTKDLVDPEQARKVFQQIEKKARHVLAKFSRPFAAANAHFVPWDHAPALIEKLEALQAEFNEAADTFVANYHQLRSAWQAAHPEIPNDAYPQSWELRGKFSFGWHAFKVSGATEAMAIDDVEAELSQRQLRQEHLDQMQAALHAECRQFVGDYVTAFRTEVAAFCDQVIEAKGQVHGKTLQAIRRKIEHFHAMNVFGDAETGEKLAKLKSQIAGVSGEDLAQQPALAQQLAKACKLIKGDLTDAESISALTGRLRRRVVLD